MEMLETLPIVFFDSYLAWEDWLREHGGEPQGVWLKIAKKGTGQPSVSYADALDVALCYGWIDGKKKACDDTYWLQKFTPRRPKSVWSKINTDKAMQLIASGRMTPAGLREIEAAKTDGRWDAAYSSQRTLTTPDDFQQALDQHPRARTFFDTLNRANRYAICYRIETAKKPETRRGRIDRFIAMLAREEKLYP